MDTFTAKANFGSGTDALAGRDTADGFVGAVLVTDEQGVAISQSNPLPISLPAAQVDALTPLAAIEVTNLPAVQPVSADALPLPTGAATDGADATGVVQMSGGVGIRGWLSGIFSKLSNPLAVTGEFWQATQPVSVAALPLPTGAASEATLAAIDGYFKAEDSPAVSGEKGIPMLAMRQIADTTSTSDDGDYTLFKIDEEGRVKVATKPASFAIVSGNITANAQTVFCDVSRASNVMISMVATTLVGHNSTFEGSIDSTDGSNGNWFGIQVVRSNANTIELVTGVLATTPVYAWEASVNGLSFIRVRATAHTSGTATWKFQRGSYATEPIPAAQISGTQPVSGTVTATVTAGTVNPVVPATPYFVNSAATTNGALVLTGTSGVSALWATNTGATAAFVKLYNKATAPTVGTDVPEMIIPVPAAVSGVPGTASLPMGFHGSVLRLGLALPSLARLQTMTPRRWLLAKLKSNFQGLCKNGRSHHHF